MNVYLTFDVEIWCGGWGNLDSAFPASFERYVYGRSPDGDYALPKTLEILNRYGLKGVFFVEPLFAGRFGAEHLRTIVSLIRSAGQEVQLHIHPEWTDEIRPPIIGNVSEKRQHLTYYTHDEQTSLIAFAKALLEGVDSGPISAFRAGSFAANRDTFLALAQCGILYDSSLNRCYSVSGPDLRKVHEFISVFNIGPVTSFPVAVFSDGLARDRPAQVGACSTSEMQDALLDAYKIGFTDFVVVSHNFEMLRPGSSIPDWIVVRRFNSLCRFLSEHGKELPVCSFGVRPAPTVQSCVLPSARFSSTIFRHVEQFSRRLR